MSTVASLQRTAMTAPSPARRPRTGRVPRNTHAGDGLRSLSAQNVWNDHAMVKPVNRRNFSNSIDTPDIPPAVDEVLRSSGQPLDRNTLSFFGQHFSHDFSRVRIHTDSGAAASARSLGAHAYTIGDHIVFAPARYSPNTVAGQHLLAHELAHVVQQEGTTPGLRPRSIADDGHPSELEAERAAEAIVNGRRPSITSRSPGCLLHRHRNDLVAYSGGQHGHLYVIAAGRIIYTANAVSGHPGRGENEPSAGPIPTGRYTIHPKVTRRTVSTLESGVCGANSIPSGYQEITSTAPSPCSGAHYCNVPCPTPAEPSRHCFTPQDCWGPHRIRIEGGQAVVTPKGRKTIRSGFYIHGGNPADAVSSGCVKSLDNGVFARIRTLSGVRGAVPFCVGTSCQPALGQATITTAAEAAQGAVEGAAQAVGDFLGGLF